MKKVLESLLLRLYKWFRLNEEKAENHSLLSNENQWEINFEIKSWDDIILWINKNLQEMLNNGAVEVNIIRGDELGDFLRKEQTEKGKYMDCSIPNEKSVILMVMSEDGSVILKQTACYKEKYPICMEKLFHGKPTLKIKLIEVNEK